MTTIIVSVPTIIRMQKHKLRIHNVLPHDALTFRCDVSKQLLAKLRFWSVEFEILSPGA